MVYNVSCSNTAGENGRPCPGTGIVWRLLAGRMERSGTGPVNGLPLLLGERAQRQWSNAAAWSARPTGPSGRSGRGWAGESGRTLWTEAREAPAMSGWPATGSRLRHRASVAPRSNTVGLGSRRVDTPVQIGQGRGSERLDQLHGGGGARAGGWDRAEALICASGEGEVGELRSNARASRSRVEPYGGSEPATGQDRRRTVGAGGLDASREPDQRAEAAPPRPETTATNVAPVQLSEGEMKWGD